ncbi:MAG: hypothetical protein DRO15_07440 [Thermoprotei archaeon]|nr:MAG: hypothetical protein DRO15_07440 [Thermoprotei archaeon]
MVVRVKIKVIVENNLSIECAVLVNASAETEIPIIALSPQEASKINLWPLENREVVVEELTSEAIGYLVPRRVKVQLLSEKNTVLSEASAYVLVKPGGCPCFIFW